MVKNFRINGIYQMTIDNSLVGPQRICFVVNRLYPVENGNPIVCARIAMCCNTDKMPDDIYRMADHIELTPELLFYLGFEVAEPLPGVDTECHFVKYITIKGCPDMIQLVLEKDRTFTKVRLNKDGSFEKVKNLVFLDDLQEIVAEEHKHELPVRLESINHHCLNYKLVPELAKYIVKELDHLGQISCEKFNQLILQKPGVLDYDVLPVFKYGLLYRLFKLIPNTYGIYISK